VRAGPLEAAGLLRVAARPLGFLPGSGVFEEPTGLRFDGSLSGPRDCSVQLTLVPDAVALFWLDPDDGPGVIGCALATRCRRPVALDAAFAVGDRGTVAGGEEWILDGAPRAGGRVIHAASRVGVSGPGLSATVSGGMSAAERAPPGWFSLCTATVGRHDAGIDLLAAAVSRAYLELGGGDDPGGLRAGIRFRLARPLWRIRAGYIVSVDLPGFAPGPFLPSEEELMLGMERRWPLGGGAWEAGLSATNRIETGPDGTASDDPSGTLSAGWASARLRAGVAFDVDRDAGAALEISTGTPDGAGKGGAGGQLRCTWTGSGGGSLSLSAHARFAVGPVEVLLRAGVRGVRSAAGGGGEPWGSVAWRVTGRPVSPPGGCAP
jgi:hypothetical protein